HDRLELEVRAALGGVPGFGIDTAGHVDHPEPERRGGGSLRLRRQGRHHGIEERQRDGGADTALQKGAAGQVLLRDDHGSSTVAVAVARATVVEVPAGSSLVRIWNGALSMMPCTIDER